MVASINHHVVHHLANQYVLINDPVLKYAP